MKYKKPMRDTILEMNNFFGYRVLFSLDKLISYKSKPTTTLAYPIEGCNDCIKISVKVPSYIAFVLYEDLTKYYAFRDSIESNSHCSLYEFNGKTKKKLVSFKGNIPRVLDKDKCLYLIEEVA